MKTSPFWRGLALLLVVGLVLPAFFADVAQADRRSGLMGHHFIKDADDAKALPQDAVLYTNRFAIDFLNSYDAGDGEAALIVGEGLTWQWRASNQNAFSPLANFAAGSTLYSPINALSGLDLNGNTSRNAANMQFVTFGVASGDNVSRWGVNLNVGMDATSEKDNLTNAAYEENEGAMLFNLVFGYSMENMDLAGEFLLGTNNYEYTDAQDSDNNRDLSGGVLGLTAFARGVLPGAFMGEDFYWAGAFGFTQSKRDHFYTLTDIGEDTYSKFGLMLEGGRVWQVNDLTATVGVMFDFASTSDDPEEATQDPPLDDNKTDMGDILLPGFHFAAEYAVTDNFTIRGGAKTEYLFEGQKQTFGSREIENGNTSYNFDWVLGMGYTRGHAELQVVINPDWVETGSVLGSQDEDMFGAVELTWNWGTK